MKKVLLSLILSLTIVIANGQDVSNTTWPQTPVLPTAGNWSIGFNVIPILSGVGNLFHAPTGNDSIFSQSEYTLVGLYVKNAQTAYRLMVRIGFGSTTLNNLVSDDASTAVPPAQVADTWTQSYMNITVGAGIQKWLGKARLRGIYGGQIDVMIVGADNTYAYGNPFSSTDQSPASTLPSDWAQGQVSGGAPYNYTKEGSLPVGGRETEDKSGTTFGFGLNGFIGIEYFFTTKMSISAEYSWGLGYTSTGEGTISTEMGNGTTAATPSTIQVANTGGSSSFALDVQNATSILLHFYF